MLQELRKSTKGTTAKIIIGLIVISFAFFGIQSILVDGGGAEIAVVNGEDIYPQELQQAVDGQKRRLLSMLGDDVDPAMLDNDRLAPQALESLINQKLLVQSAKGMGLSISESEIGAVVAGIRDFQIDGVFSPERYKGMLSGAGFTPASYKVSLRDDLLLNQVSTGLAASEFITSLELEYGARAMAETRDIRFYTIPPEKFADAIAPTEAQLQRYYDANNDNFRTEESVDLQYVQLSLDDFRAPVTESVILAAYEQAKLDYQYQTQSRVSHILFEPNADEDAALQQRIAEVQQKLAAGESFAELARQYSDDIGSSDKGGDLGYTSGETFPVAMEEAISGLELDAVSGPVMTDAGTHLILLTERKAGQAPSLEELRANLEDTIQQDEARVLLLRTVEELRDLAFNADDLTGPAEEFDLTVKNVTGITRDQTEGLFSNPLLLASAFSDEVLVAGHNSDVIELPAETFVALRVSRHRESQVQDLGTVRERVMAAVTEAAVRDAVSAEAQTALDRLRAGVDIDEYATAQGYALRLELAIERNNAAVASEVLQRAFALPRPEEQSPAFDFVLSPNGDAVVIELSRVIPGDFTALPQAEQEQLQQVLKGEYGSLIYQEYQQDLREKAEIIVL